MSIQFPRGNRIQRESAAHPALIGEGTDKESAGNCQNFRAQLPGETSVGRRNPTRLHAGCCIATSHGRPLVSFSRLVSPRKLDTQRVARNGDDFAREPPATASLDLPKFSPPVSPEKLRWGVAAPSDCMRAAASQLVTAGPDLANFWRLVSPGKLDVQRVARNVDDVARSHRPWQATI